MHVPIISDFSKREQRLFFLLVAQSRLSFHPLVVRSKRFFGYVFDDVLILCEMSEDSAFRGPKCFAEFGIAFVILIGSSKLLAIQKDNVRFVREARDTIVAPAGAETIIKSLIK